MSASSQSHDLDDVGLIPEVPGPGEQLRTAREAAGMSVHEIATHLRLDSRVILALEADDYEKLPAPIFTRGYLRGYARLLGLPPEPVLQAFEQSDVSPPSLVADLSVDSKARSGDFPIRIVTYLVIAALIVLVVLWWRSQDFALARFDAGDDDTGTVTSTQDEGSLVVPLREDATEPEAAPAAAPDEAATEPTIPAPEPSALPASPPASADQSVAPEPLASTLVPEEEVSEGESEPAAEEESATGEAEESETSEALAAGEDGVGDEDSVPDTADPEEENAAAAEEEEPPSETSAAAPAEAGSEEGADETSAAELGAVPPSSEPEPEPEPEESPAAAPGGVATDRMELAFVDECWVEVYDRAEERLFYGLALPGDRLNLSGQGPIRVVIGNSERVEVRYNGTPIEFSAFSSRGVARFHVGGDPPVAYQVPNPDQAPAPDGSPESDPEDDSGATDSADDPDDPSALG